MINNANTPPDILRCVNPALVDPADVPAYCEGEGRPEFNQHLPQCPFCQAEVAEYQALAANLHRQLLRTVPPHRLHCPDAQLLGEYSLNLLRNSLKNHVKEHLKTCQFCPSEYNFLKTELTEPKTEPDFFENMATQAASVLRRVSATLFQPPQLAQMALRGTTSLYNGTYEFRSEDVRVVVQVQFTKPNNRHSVNVFGSVSRDDFEFDELAGATVRLDYKGQALGSEKLDETGGFFFQNLQLADQATLILEVELDDKIVVLDELKAN